jgi:hypothetical protein
MNGKAQSTANKIMAAFESGGILPLEHEQPEKYAEIVRHVFGVLSRAMESKQEKRSRKWAGFQRAMNEKQAAQ